MKVDLVYLGFLLVLTEAVTASEFRLDGDFLLGGLFDIHHVSKYLYRDRPETITCSSQPFALSSYRRFQVMRFAVEEINNSTTLLPNVTLGYKMLDLCSDTQNFPGIFDLISVNSSIKPWDEPLKNLSKMIAVVGHYTSTVTLSVAPLIMMNSMPVVSYGASSSVLSRKENFPSFLRTVHPNKDVIAVIYKILQEFDWSWVSFLYIEDDYGRDGRDLFIKTIENSNPEICLGYTKGLDPDTDHAKVFQQIESLHINVIIVLATEFVAEPLIKYAISKNITEKVWIAGDAWSLHKSLPKEDGIRNIGTVLGLAEPALTMPGFNDFIYSSKARHQRENSDQEFCHQNCKCTNVTAEDIINADPSYNFPVYSAVYAIAHALHTVLQCEDGSCNTSIREAPQMVLKKLWSSHFNLLNQTVQFDENGDPKFGSFSIVFWNHSGDAEVVGFYHYYPSVRSFINKTKIQWHKSDQHIELVPMSFCTKACDKGHKKTPEGIHKCCFNCTKCPKGTYVNSTEDPYSCKDCLSTEWSAEGSASCKARLVEVVPFSDAGAIVLLIWTLAFMGLCVAVSVLFAINYNTPVVKSAGGPICFLFLGCLSLCSLSVFFNFGNPSNASCVFQFLPILLFFIVCLACLFVRSFQIVYIFKIAKMFPKLFNLWVKYHGQWLVIALAFVTQALLLTIGYSVDPPKPYSDTELLENQIILRCDLNHKAVSAPLALIVLLSLLTFYFSYEGKDLPKNYNEAKAITFSLLMLVIIWTIYGTIFLYRSKNIQIIRSLSVLLSLYSFLFWYFLPKCYIIIFQPEKNTQQYFQSLIQSYTKISSQQLSVGL